MRARLVLAAGAALGLLAVAAAIAWQRGWTWNHPDPSRFPVQGIDVSHHQGAIDWRSVASEGWIRFAYVKATEGGDWIDPEFGRNWTAARREGLRVGAYHFFTFCAPGIEQARHFLRVVPPAAVALPAALDVEGGGACARPAREEILREIRAWCRAVEAATGKPPVIYVTDESYRSILAGSGIEYRLWIRDLFREPVPAAGEAWSFWQWHSRGRIRGVKGLVDLDAYRAEVGPFEGI
jgi:lysozyme